MAEDLRQDDAPQDLPVVQAERLSRLELPPGNGLKAAAKDLGLIAGEEEGEGDDHPPDLVAVQPVRKQDGHHHGGGEQRRQQRQRANKVDQDGDAVGDHRELGASRQRQPKTHWHADQDDRGEEKQGERQAAPLIGGDLLQADGAAFHQEVVGAEADDPQQGQAL